MDFSFTPEQEKFRQEVREFLRREVTEELIQEAEWGTLIGMGPAMRVFYRKLGEKRWVCPSLPKEYGGLGANHIERLILDEELMYHRAMPPVMAGARVVAPTLIMYGGEELKHEFLPRIAQGEIEFALGYTEPDAGSDLANLSIKADEKDDYFVINGGKIFNTGCDYVDYVWLAARTDFTSPKHRGISLFIVDLKTPGISLNPLYTMDSEKTNEVFYDDVKVPKKYLVGEKNRGFHYVATALAFERNFPVGLLRRNYEDLVEYVKETGKNTDPLVRQKLAQLKIELEIAWVFSYQVALLAEKGVVPEWQAPMTKIFGTELMWHMGCAGLEILGLYGQLQQGSKWAPLYGRFEHLYKHARRRMISAGTNEVLRNTIAIRSLGLPRS
jgi:alkylation response protein AidB-like acyl-CoA dehydrogenase